MTGTVRYILVRQFYAHRRCREGHDPDRFCIRKHRIRLKNGSDLFINMTDQMGSAMLKGSGPIIDTLRRAGVQAKTEIKEIRSLGFETLRLPK